MGSSLGFLENPCGSMPRARDSGGPVRPHPTGRPGTAFRSHNSVGVRLGFDFGAESSRPASWLCTLRTHRSPGEWQHWLPACWLALAGRDSHPLDSTKRFHWLISAPPLPSFSQRDMRLNSKCAHQARPPLGPYRGWLGGRSPLGDYHYVTIMCRTRNIAACDPVQTTMYPSHILRSTVTPISTSMPCRAMAEDDSQ